MFVSEEMYRLGSCRSAIRELFEYGKQRAAVVGPENVYDFSLGNPSVPAPAVVNDTLQKLLQEFPSTALHGYTSAQGDQKTRQSIVDYLNQTYGTAFRADNIYMTCGAAASLTITLRALTVSPEDEFLVLAPFFPEYTVFIRNAGAKPVIVPADLPDFQINFEALAERLSAHTKAIIVNSPNNPSGAVYSESTLQKLAALLTEKADAYGHPIYLITDEPYREIVYGDSLPPYVTKYYKDTVVCYSFSKSLSLPGERIGYILVPDEATDSENVYYAVCGAGRSLGYVCAPSLMQKMIPYCIGHTGDIDAYRRNRDLLYGALTRIGFDCVKPEGAFYLFMKSPIEDADAFCERAKQEDLLIVSATGFGCPGYVRLSYCVDHDMIVRSIPAFERLYAAYQKQA